MTATPIHDELQEALRRRALPDGLTGATGATEAVGAPGTGTGPDGDDGPELDAEARRVLTLARDEAAAHGRARWGTGHLLLGMLRAGGAVGSLLGAAGVSAGAARRRIARHEALSAPGGGDDTLTFSPRPCSPAAQSVLDAARTDAAAAGRTSIGPADLLAGVFSATEPGTASMLLSELDVPDGELAAAARTLAVRPAPEPTAARWRDPSRLLRRHAPAHRA